MKARGKRQADHQIRPTPHPNTQTQIESLLPQNVLVCGRGRNRFSGVRPAALTTDDRGRRWLYEIRRHVPYRPIYPDLVWVAMLRSPKGSGIPLLSKAMGYCCLLAILVSNPNYLENIYCRQNQRQERLHSLFELLGMSTQLTVMGFKAPSKADDVPVRNSVAVMYAPTRASHEEAKSSFLWNKQDSIY
jgi:hypothetical protein